MRIHLKLNHYRWLISAGRATLYDVVNKNSNNDKKKSTREFLDAITMWRIPINISIGLVCFALASMKALSSSSSSQNSSNLHSNLHQ